MLRGLFEEELARRKQEYGRWDVRTAQAARDLGMFLSTYGDAASAQIALAEAVSMDEKVLGATDAQTLADVAELAAVSPALQAEPLWKRAAASADTGLAARALGALGQIRENAGDRDGAVKFYGQALAKEEAGSGRDSPRVAVRLSALARMVGAPAAIGLLERALAIDRRRLGARHPETATVQAHLAGLLLGAKRVDEAARYSRDAMAIFEENLGRNDPHVAAAAAVLAGVLRAKGENAEAERMYRRALAIDEQAYGRRHRQTVSDVRALAGFLRENGRSGEAVALENRKLSGEP
jgi:tetratricopeptide (TPR) repeat protein